MKNLIFATAMAVSLGLGAQAQAGIVTYIGADNNVASLADMTNSVAAAASFDAATPGSSLITFENALPASVTISGGSITSNSTCGALCGFNTTPGGENFLLLYGGSATFNFADPISLFGAYFTGLQTNYFAQQTVTFTDGSSESINFPSAVQGDSGGGGAFIGFTDAGKSIASVTINATNDIIAVDVVRYGNGAAGVPEAASWALMITGFFGMGAALRRRRTSALA